MKSQVIVPGAVKAGRKVSGFNLNKFVKKLLESMGFAVTTDCCTYYPTFPLLPNDDTSLLDVPPGGMFRLEENPERIYYRGEDGQFYYIVASAY